MRVFEDAMGSADTDLQEPISVSFLENLNSNAENYDYIEAVLGPRLRVELSRKLIND